MSRDGVKLSVWILYLDLSVCYLFQVFEYVDQDLFHYLESHKNTGVNPTKVKKFMYQVFILLLALNPKIFDEFSCRSKIFVLIIDENI